jgi:hypothetical protein
MLMAISNHQGIIGTLPTPCEEQSRFFFHESASRIFGHYEQITPNQNTAFTTILYKWLNIISRAIRKSNNQKKIWDQKTRSDIRTYNVADIPL